MYTLEQIEALKESNPDLYNLLTASIDEYNEAIEYGDKWDAYYEQVKPIVDAYSEGKLIDAATARRSASQDGGNNGKGYNKKGRGNSMDIDEQGLSELINKTVEGLLQKYASPIMERLEQQDRMIDYSLQYSEFLVKHPDADANKVLETMRTKKLSSLEDAYTDAYHDDIVGKKAQEIAESKIKEERERMKTERSPEAESSTETPYTPSFSKEGKFQVPSFSEATRSAMDEIKSGTLHSTEKSGEGTK